MVSGDGDRHLTVKQLGDSASDKNRWDAFVEACEEATFFHLAGWKAVVEGSYGHDCPYLVAEQNGRIQGILPLVHIKSLIFGNAIISNAFCVRGGPVAITDAASLALDAEAVRLAEERGVDYLEFRLNQRAHSGWLCKGDLYVNFARTMDPDPEKNMLAIPRKQRAMVRKGVKGGLVGEIDDGIERFFRLYAESLRNLGTPVHSKRFFQSLRDVFGDQCEITTVVCDSGPVSAVLTFYFRDRVLPYYGGGSPRARDLAAFDFMYWDVMRRACEKGYRIFDYGRSKRGTGSFAFKKHWGFEPEPLHYEYKLIRQREAPNVNPLNPKYRTFIALWKRLPLPIANALGPYLAKQLG
jgi:FemAB-related protein (PEP-CTERM system-associated)